MTLSARNSTPRIAKTRDSNRRTRLRSAPSRIRLAGKRLAPSDPPAGISIAFRPNRSSTQLCRAHSGRYSPKTSIPPNSNAQNRPPPFAENCASPAHNRRCSGKKTTIGDTTVPSKQPTIHRREPDQTSRAQAKTACRLRHGSNFPQTKDPPAPTRQFHRRSSKTGP
jgi:hypothetical protein